MSIFNFVQKLLPRIERSHVAEDLRTTEKECLTAVIPSWEAAANYFRMNKPSSDELLEMNLIFRQNYTSDVRAAKSPTFIMDVARLAPVLHANIVTVQTNLDKYVEKDIISEGLTIRSAFLVRAASNMSLLTRYMLALLNYVYTAEAKHFDTTLEPGLEISKAEMKYVDQNFLRFVKLFSEYTMDNKEFAKLITSNPEVFVNSKTKDAVTAMFDGRTGDPFEKFGVSGFVGNPIYRIRLLFAKWQTDRYESAKSKKQVLELRLLYLQMQQDKKQDPSVTTEIQRLQERIENYDRYLRDVEESVAKDE